MRQVFTSVQPIPVAAPGTPHPREGQAGKVVSVPANDPDHIGVQWDVDGAVTVEAVSALRQLA